MKRKKNANTPSVAAMAPASDMEFPMLKDVDGDRKILELRSVGERCSESWRCGRSAKLRSRKKSYSDN